MFPFKQLNCGIGHRQDFHPSYSCDIPQIWHLIEVRGIPPHKPPLFTPITHWHHIQASLFKLLYGINSPLPRLIYWATTCTIPYIDPLTNLVILHSLHMAEPSENAFINTFVHSLRHSTQINSLICAFWTLSILLTSELFICTCLILDLSFSFHIIASLPYIRTGTSNVS